MEEDHISETYTSDVERKKKNIRGIKMADPVPESTPGHHSAVVSGAIPDNLDPVPLENNGAPSLSPIMATITMDLDENDLNLYLEERTCLMGAISMCEGQCCSKNVNGDINACFSEIHPMVTDDMGRRQVLQSRAPEPILPPPGPSLDLLAEPLQHQLESMELEEVRDR